MYVCYIVYYSNTKSSILYTNSIQFVVHYNILVRLLLLAVLTLACANFCTNFMISFSVRNAKLNFANILQNFEIKINVTKMPIPYNGLCSKEIHFQIF